MEIVLEAINQIVSYELAVVLSLEEDNCLHVRQARGPLVSPRLKEHVIPLEKHREIAEIIEKGSVHLFHDDVEGGYVHLDPYHDILDLPAGHSCMVAPLTVEGTTLGVLTLDHRACDMFTPQIVRTTETLARIIALALAQSMAAETLLTEREALAFERNTLLSGLPDSIEGMIGHSGPWKEVLDKVRIVAATPTPVLIMGETGTGKEQIARTIHALSPRSHRPFVALNCSALVTSLAESELFGHERGAFTGAVARRKGRFELANNGTLFLDEIGDLPLEVQPKLLRTLQEGTFERVGGEVPIKADVRIICATHVDLEKAVERREFREDLFYRLNVFPIFVPPLRERGDDVFLLADYFLKKLAEQFERDGFRLTEAAYEYLQSYTWPGNVRELMNTLERAAILCQGDTIDVVHLQIKRNGMRRAESAEASHSFPTLDESVRRHILRALERSGGKIYGKDGAAALLGLKPTTLQSKMKKLGISLK